MTHGQVEGFFLVYGWIICYLMIGTVCSSIALGLLEKEVGHHPQREMGFVLAIPLWPVIFPFFLFAYGFYKAVEYIDRLIR